MKTKNRTAVKLPEKQKEVKQDLSKTYNEFKEFEGKQYTGMKVGRHHKWYYDKGNGRKRKLLPLIGNLLMR